MATVQIPVSITNQDSGVPSDLIDNQITAATAPSIGTQTCYVMADGGADEGVYVEFTIPQDYVGSPQIVTKGILDGAPGASDTLGFGFRKRAVADNEGANSTFDAEETVSNTIGSSGQNYSNEDQCNQAITLTAGNYAAGDTVYGYLYIDASGTSYAGNFLLTEIVFQYGNS